MIFDEALGLDDIYIVPEYSDVAHRADIDLKVELPKGFSFSSPIVPANMRDVASYELLSEAMKNDAMCLLHRFSPVEIISEIYEDLISTDINGYRKVGISVGVKEEDYDRVDMYVNAGCEILCVDVAHAHSKACIDMCMYIASVYPDVLLIAGNVCTRDAADALYDIGVDIVKCGLGNGAVCTTRTVAGVGVPQASALRAVCEAWRPGKGIIADGGIRYPGDVMKCLALGADMVMVGNLLARTVEAGNGGSYEGSSRMSGSYIEGVSKPVKPEFIVDEVFENIHRGVRSGMSYLNCRTLNELHAKDVKFVRVSASESRRDRDK